MDQGEFHQTSSMILNEIETGIAQLDSAEIDALVSNILSARQIFCIGAGRSGIIMQAFCMRLNHLGLNAFWVGSITCPPATSKDLVIACSGSGKTTSVISIIRKAKGVGTKIAVITSLAKSDILPYTDTVIHVNAPCGLVNEKLSQSRQPMRTLFEQIVFILCESIISMLQKRCGISEKDMAKHHTNLE